MASKLLHGFMLFLFVGINLSVCKKTDDLKVEFLARHPEVQEVTRLLGDDRESLVGYQPTAPARKIEEAFFQFNKATVFSKHRLEQIEQAMRQLQMAVSRYLEDQGKDGLRLLAFWLVEKFERRFHALVVASREKAVARALSSGITPTGKAHEAYRHFVEVAGDFLTHAAKSGLITLSAEKGIQHDRESMFFMRLAFKVRWSRILPEITKPLSWLLTDFERNWYKIWVAERSKNASLQRRLSAIAQLVERDPNYPKHLARGIVYYQNKRYERAIAEFTKAQKKDPKDQRIESFLKKARRKLL